MPHSIELTQLIAEKFPEKSKQLQSVASFLQMETPLSDFPDAEHAPLLDQLRQLCMWLGNAASKELHVQAVVTQYQQMREVLESLYADATVWQRASEIKQMPDGSEYQMLAEMTRDVAKYYQKVGILTGNAVFIQKASQWFEAATSFATVDSCAYVLAQLEQTHNDVTLIGASRTKSEQTDLLAGYVWLTKLTESTGGDDRQQAAAWMLLEVARKLGNVALFYTALKELTAAYLLKRVAAKVIRVVQRVKYRSTQQNVKQSADDMFALYRTEKQKLV